MACDDGIGLEGKSPRPFSASTAEGLSRSSSLPCPSVLKLEVAAGAVIGACLFWSSHFCSGVPSTVLCPDSTPYEALLDTSSLSRSLHHRVGSKLLKLSLAGFVGEQPPSAECRVVLFDPSLLEDLRLAFVTLSKAGDHYRGR